MSPIAIAILAAFIIAAAIVAWAFCATAGRADDSADAAKENLRREQWRSILDKPKKGLELPKTIPVKPRSLPGDIHYPATPNPDKE